MARKSCEQFEILGFRKAFALQFVGAFILLQNLTKINVLRKERLDLYVCTMGKGPFGANTQGRGERRKTSLHGIVYHINSPISWTVKEIEGFISRDHDGKIVIMGAPARIGFADEKRKERNQVTACSKAPGIPTELLRWFDGCLKGGTES